MVSPTSETIIISPSLTPCFRSSAKTVPFLTGGPIGAVSWMINAYPPPKSDKTTPVFFPPHTICLPNLLAQMTQASNTSQGDPSLDVLAAALSQLTMAVAGSFITSLVPCFHPHDEYVENTATLANFLTDQTCKKSPTFATRIMIY